MSDGIFTTKSATEPTAADKSHDDQAQVNELNPATDVVLVTFPYSNVQIQLRQYNMRRN